MKTIEKIVTHLDDIDDWDWLFCSDKGNVFAVKEDLPEVARQWGISERAIEDLDNAFRTFSSELIDNLKKDLQDIWKRLDEIESKEHP